MKISEAKIRKLIRESLLVSEVVDLATGTTDFETVRFAKCEKINFPPIFREIFFQFTFGQTPRDMANNVRRHLTGKTPRGTTAEIWAQNVNALVNEETFDTIMGYVNQFMNVVGVPAVFCKFLQQAVDLFADIANLFYDRNAASDEPRANLTSPFNKAFLEALESSAEYNLSSQGNDVLNRLVQINITDDSVSSASSDYKTSLYMLVSEDLMLFLSSVAVPGVDHISGGGNDNYLLGALDTFFSSYNDFLSTLRSAQRRISHTTNIEEVLTQIAEVTSSTLFESLDRPRRLRDIMTKVLISDKKELIKSFDQNMEGKDDDNVKREKQGLVSQYIEMINYIVRLMLMHVMQDIPNRAGQPDYRQYYRETPKFINRLNAIAGQLGLVN